jgi:CBS domain-containing protein
MKTRGSLISDTVFYTDQQSEMQYFQTLSYNNIRTTATIMVSEVAQLMAEMRVNSAVVCEANVPIGIVTDTDMSSKIATGRFPITVAVNKIMSTPVVTVPKMFHWLKHNC